MKKQKKDKPLTVFNPPYYPLRYLSNWKNNFKTFFRQFKNAYQRATLGFCDEDTWDINKYLLTLLPELLTRFKELNNGYPDQCETYEDWNKIIDSIIQKMNEARDSSSEEVLIFGNKETEKLKVTDNTTKEIHERIQKHIKLTKEAFVLLSEYLDDLWW